MTLNESNLNTNGNVRSGLNVELNLSILLSETHFFTLRFCIQAQKYAMLHFFLISRRDFTRLWRYFSVASVSNSYPRKHPFVGRYKFVYFGFHRVLALPSKSFLSLRKLISWLKLSELAFRTGEFNFPRFFFNFESMHHYFHNILMLAFCWILSIL